MSLVTSGKRHGVLKLQRFEALLRIHVVLDGDNDQAR